MTVLITPTMADSVITDRLTCLGVAPMARHSPISRTRWPTMIWNVLLMMNADTNTAMNANTSRIVLKMSMTWLKSSSCSAASTSAVTTL